MLGGLLGSYAFAARASREDARELERRLEAIHKSRMRSAKTSAERARELEHDLGRVALLARALAEVCLQKGLLTKAELGAMLLEVDIADGVGDGSLDPRVVMPGESKLADLEPQRAPPVRVRRRQRPR